MAAEEVHIQKQGFHIVYDDPDMTTRKKYPKIAKVDRRGSGYIASRTSMDDPFAQEIINATRSFVGDDLILMPSLGGSLPIYLFTDYLYILFSLGSLVRSCLISIFFSCFIVSLGVEIQSLMLCTALPHRSVARMAMTLSPKTASPFLMRLDIRQSYWLRQNMAPLTTHNL